jgi:DNA-binding LytR/AlgR family response regulator
MISSTPPPYTALIAEDEPLLARELQSELALICREMQTHHAADGLHAVKLALELRPEVLFLDVRMPGCSGLEAAQDIADQWPQDRALPALVFVTAFDQYAVQAFEQAAMDYIVKPVRRERLQQCVARIQEKYLPQNTKNKAVFHQNQPLAPENIAPNAIDLVASSDEQLLSGLRQLILANTTQGTSPALLPRLQRIQASVGSQIVFIPIEDVICLQAADKYVRVLTAERAGSHAPKEVLIRTPIKELLPQLDGQEFWQIHRSTLVRASRIERVLRDESGKLRLELHNLKEQIPVSRLYAHLFKAM